MTVRLSVFNVLYASSFIFIAMRSIIQLKNNWMRQLSAIIVYNEDLYAYIWSILYKCKRIHSSVDPVDVGRDANVGLRAIYVTVAKGGNCNTNQFTRKSWDKRIAHIANTETGQHSLCTHQTIFWYQIQCMWCTLGCLEFGVLQIIRKYAIFDKSVAQRNDLSISKNWRWGQRNSAYIFRKWHTTWKSN